MKACITDTRALRQISPQALVAFARSEGWARLEDYGKHSDVFAGDTLPEIIIPRTNRLGDYATVVRGLVEAFARQTGQDELTIYRSLIGADQDVIRIRAIGAEDTDTGTLRLEDGVGLIAQSRDLLLAAACAAGGPRRLYRAGANKEATEYMRRVRLGQTEHGSFTVTLLSPVAPQLQIRNEQDGWGSIEDEPEERRVTRKLIRALRAARNATERAPIEGIEVFEKAVPEGVSANLCESLASIIERTVDLEVSLTWARTRPTPEVNSRVDFSHSDAQTLREAGRLFKAKEPKENFELTGPVIVLKRDEKATSGDVTLKACIDGKVQSVKLNLGGDAYSLAVNAHDTKDLILASGDLEREGRRWVMRNPTVQALAPDPEESDDETGQGEG